MKRNIFTILTLVAIVSCNPNNTSVKSKFERLSSFYKDTSFSSIYIYPDTTHIAPIYFFKGNQIDSTTFTLLTEKATQNIPWTEGFYGIYSFKINKELIGLITRTPGLYSSSMISLWIYDIKNDSITNSIKLADEFGDAGASESTNSYLFFDKERQLKTLTYIRYYYDHSIGEEADSTIEENHNYYLTKISSLSLDTISKDSSKLNEQFREELIRMGL